MDTFQNMLRMPETMDNTEQFKIKFMYFGTVEFNNNNKIEQLQQYTVMKVI